MRVCFGINYIMDEYYHVAILSAAVAYSSKIKRFISDNKVHIYYTDRQIESDEGTIQLN